MPKPYPKYRRRRMRKPPPFTEDNVLRSIGLGITLGEGSAGCDGRSPKLHVEMCDETAVNMVAKSWGTTILRTRPLQCRPTEKNPEGRGYITEAVGVRAEAIMKAYQPEVTGTELHRKWLKAQQECPKREPRKYKKRLSV